MSQTIKADQRRMATALSAGLASCIALSVSFIATMLLHYRAIEFPYLSYALLRILAISGSICVIAALAARHLRSFAAAALFGGVAGFLGGVAFVVAAA